MKVCFLALDPSEASARTRAQALFPALARAGVEAELRRWPRKAAAFAELTAFDVVVLVRVLVPRWALKPLRRAAKSLVLDVDDALWRRPRSGRAPFRLRRRLLRTLAIADLVTCGSAHLRDLLRHRHPRLRLLPPSVPIPARVPPRADPPEVLWTGSRATLPYLEERGPSLAEALNAQPLVVVADRAPTLPAGIDLRFVAWTPEAEVEALQRAQIGLYPLPRDPWSEGKCAFKVWLYMAYGLASLSVPWGGGGEALREGGGLLFEDEASFVRELRRLCSDQGLRERLGREARSLCAARGGHELRAASLAAALLEATSIGARRRSRMS